MSRGLIRRLALMAGTVGITMLGGCYGVYSYGYYDPCPPPPPAGCETVVVVHPHGPPRPPVYVAPAYRCGLRW